MKIHKRQAAECGQIGYNDEDERTQRATTTTTTTNVARHTRVRHASRRLADSGNDLMPAPARHEAHEQVLALAFEGRWSCAEMAAHVGVSARTIERWTAHDEFKAEIARRRANLAESLMGVAYADKTQRVIALSQMAESARREYEARPLLVERRPTGRDEDTGETLYLEQESFNRDAHEAFRKSLDDIAKELGERATKNEPNAAHVLIVAIRADVLEAV